MILTVQRYGVFSRVPNVFAIFWPGDSDKGARGRQMGRRGRGFVAPRGGKAAKDGRDEDEGRERRASRGCGEAAKHGRDEDKRDGKGTRTKGAKRGRGQKGTRTKGDEKRGDS